jgi:uncharacterized membrane protein
MALFASAKQVADALAAGLELAGVAAILGGIGLAFAVFAAGAVRSGDWKPHYDRLRANIGRGILLGLELLVGSDIIATVTAPLTFESVGLLAMIVVIRTALSFSLEIEIEGRWPWRRAEAAAGSGAAER